MGAAYRDSLASAGDAAVGSVMRLGHARVTRVVVTRPDGSLVGLFFAAGQSA